MNLLLVYPPFCTPTMRPYSISYLQGFLTNNGIKTKCLDLNAKFHRSKFKEHYQSLKSINDPKSYASLLEQAEISFRETYSKNHKTIVKDEPPELLPEMVHLIVQEKPETVAFSLVYNSQNFYTLALIKELKKLNIKIILGGPAVNNKLKEEATFLANEVEFLHSITKNKDEKYKYDTIPHFQDFLAEDYFSLALILPLKTTSTCFYQQCTFCTHFAKVPYFESDLNLIKQTIIQDKAQYLFFIDDMISTPRLLKLAAILKPLAVKWWCQLRPTKDLIPHLTTLAQAGLSVVGWGFESGSQRILDLIDKGTNIADIQAVFQASHQAGIKNSVQFIIGFPTETKDEFVSTIQFLEKNKDTIDFVSPSLFGLQKGSYIYQHPDEFKIATVNIQNRSVLDEKITFEISEGLNHEQARALRTKYRKSLAKLNKLPAVLNGYKEQMLMF